MDFKQQEDSEDFYLAKIGDHTFVLEECKDFPKGLSHREHLLENEGMLFNFSDPGDRTFHMRDCLIPLDILFIKDGKINKIYHECQPCEIDECDKYVGEADSVVELLGGTCKKNNISEGLIYRHF
jgi:hypothetical protein